MIIACNINNEYIRHCAVMLCSLALANPRDDLQVYIVHSKLDSDQRAKLVGYLNSILPAVSFLHVDDSLLQDFPESAHVKLASYYRIFLPEILPQCLDRIIYIDSDVLVNGSLDELWTLPLDGYRLAAASDRNLPMQRERLNLAVDAPYFNAGVMTFRLSEWRGLNLAARGLEYARLHPERLINCDQDVLNHLFEKQCRLLPQRWNAMSHLWGMDPQWLRDNGGLNRDEEEAISDPAIIHFAGAGRAKPWHADCPHPWKDRYRELLAQTPWAHTPLEGKSSQPGLALRSWRRLKNRLRHLRSGG